MNLKEVVLNKIQESGKSIEELSLLARVPVSMIQRLINGKILPTPLLMRLEKIIMEVSE